MSDPIFDIYDRLCQKSEHCFLCGIELDANSTTPEHVFPRWLQNKFNLWDKKLELPNKTLMPYRQVTIPCCKKCNNNPLAQLEKTIQNAILHKTAYEITHSETIKHLWLWLSKIFFGLIYQKTLLKKNRENKNSPPILTKEDLKKFRTLHLFVQGIRMEGNFSLIGKSDLKVPASIFVYDIEGDHNTSTLFDFIDDLNLHNILMRLNNKGILLSYDCGAQEIAVGELCRKHLKKKINTEQFYELGAKLFYKSTLFNKEPFFITSQTENEYKTIIQLQNMKHKNRTDNNKNVLFDEWQQEHYAEFVAFFLGLPIEDVMPKPGMVTTWFD